MAPVTETAPTSTMLAPRPRRPVDPAAPQTAQDLPAQSPTPEEPSTALHASGPAPPTSAPTTSAPGASLKDSPEASTSVRCFGPMIRARRGRAKFRQEILQLNLMEGELLHLLPSPSSLTFSICRRYRHVFQRFNSARDHLHKRRCTARADSGPNPPRSASPPTAPRGALLPVHGSLPADGTIRVLHPLPATQPPGKALRRTQRAKKARGGRTASSPRSNAWYVDLTPHP